MKRVLKDIVARLNKSHHPSHNDNQLTKKISRKYPWGQIDSIEIEQSGLLRIKGFLIDNISDLTGLRVRVNGREIVSLNSYTTYSPEEAKTFSSHTPFCGLVIEYLLHPVANQEITNIDIRFNNEILFQSDNKISLTIPHFDGLFSENRVLHRDNIYGYGPPVVSVGTDIQALSKFLTSPVIDFGCGSGALVKMLRAEGYEAFGIEIKRQPIIDSLIKDAEPYIILYDGQTPLPYENNAFESGICTEVLEHVADYETVLSELARIIKKRLIVTVPDISAIPLLHRHKVVPWHLLESTHVNFFTQSSLSCLLKRYFKRVEFKRAGLISINQTKFYVHLVAIADK